MGKFGITELLVILAIVVLLFGTRKLKNMGGDIGGSIKSFRKALKDDGQSSAADDTTIVHHEETTNQ
jgi:sec-independent protein translocase protein TatA